MKKIFLPLLALCGMVSCLTLTSCGGGGGSTGYSGKKIRYYSPLFAGSMLVEFGDKIDETSYAAWVSFGEEKESTPYQGKVTIQVGEDNPAAPSENGEQTRLQIELQGSDNFGIDEGVRMYFAEFLPDDFDIDGTLYGFPKPLITMTYTSKKGGTYASTFTFIGDNPDTEDKVEIDFETPITRDGMTFNFE